MPENAQLLQIWGSYEQLRVRYDAGQKAVWYTLKPRSRPCFNLDLLAELRRFQGLIVQALDSRSEAGPGPLQYLVLASAVPGVFNLGGDLDLFGRLIRRKDRDGLFHYAKACIDVLYPNAIGFDRPVTTISLVQGHALGGGFEAAVSSHVVIAERSARFGLPEVLFNLIPGMGAYSFLVRRTGPANAERIITSGRTYSAQEMFDLDLVDVLADDGQGEQAVRDYIATHRRRHNAYTAMQRARRCVDPITYEELIAVTKVWVDAALCLTDRNLLMIERLVKAQDRRHRAGKRKLQSREGNG